MPAFDCLNENSRTKGLGFFIYLCVFICENNSYLCCRQLRESLRPSELIKISMKTFEFEIIETLARIVEIEAVNAEDAREQLENAYKNEDIVLDADDWIDTQINPIEGG